MRNLFTAILLFCSLSIFSQKKYFIIFNENSDNITYNKQGDINLFKIKINDKKHINFVMSDIKSNFNRSKFELKPNISRLQLNNIVQKDDPSKRNKYIIVIKKSNVYNFYFVDHIFRTIVD